MTGLEVERVTPGSIGDEVGIEAGDRLLAINGEPIRDIIDYNFHAADDELVIEVAKPNGEVWEIELERDDGEPLGLTFPPPKPRQCGNECVFCFVDQLPAGLRPSLYVKDEDYRLSFLYGNYITLTNLAAKDLARIKEQRLSPLYISVHATEPALRERLIGRPGIPPILDLMSDLAAAGITMHAQVVLCPGWNDGAELEKTVADLATLYPRVASLAVVPLGLTGHREGLAALTPVSIEYAREFLTAWEPKARALSARLGGPFLFLADEFYLKGGVPFPPLESYGDLPQIENGVGMVPLFQAEAAEVLAEALPLRPVRGVVVTGESAFPILSPFVANLARATGTDLATVAVKNRLFGGGVTVTGLVSGSDIVMAFPDGVAADALFVPDVMLKEGEGMFLDDSTVAGLEEALGIQVIVAESSPAGLYAALTEVAG